MVSCAGRPGFEIDAVERVVAEAGGTGGRGFTDDVAVGVVAEVEVGGVNGRGGAGGEEEDEEAEDECQTRLAQRRALTDDGASQPRAQQPQRPGRQGDVGVAGRRALDAGGLGSEAAAAS